MISQVRALELFGAIALVVTSASALLHARGGPHDLVGKRGVAETELAPHGTVRIRAERWRASCALGVERIAAGASVRVVEVEGLTAVVEPAS